MDAVLSGTPGSRQLRAVLARLESKQQALVFGHAVPLPVVLHTREYGAELYESVGRNGAADVDRLEQELQELF